MHSDVDRVTVMRPLSLSGGTKIRLANSSAHNLLTLAVHRYYIVCIALNITSNMAYLNVEPSETHGEVTWQVCHQGIRH